MYDHNPHTQMSLLDAMNAACEDTSAEDCEAWIRHAKRLFPGVWRRRLFVVMLMKICGQMQETGWTVIIWFLFGKK